MRKMLWLALLLPCVARAEEIPIKDFARDGDVSEVKISPDGKHYSEVQHVEGSDFLVIRDLATGKVTGTMKSGKDRRIGSYWWVSPARLVMSFSEQYGTLAVPFGTGELLGIDFDQGQGNRAPTYLFGFRGGESMSSRLKGYARPDERVATIIGRLDKDGRHAIIEVNSFPGDPHPGYGEVDRLDVYNGTREKIATGPVQSYTSFLVDQDGNARIAVGEDPHTDEYRSLSYVKSNEEGGWSLLGRSGDKGAQVIPERLSTDNQRAFFLASDDDRPLCLVEQRLEGGERRKLSCDPGADVSSVIMSFDRKEPIAAVYLSAPPWIRVLDGTSPDVDRYKSLQMAFPGQIAIPVSATADQSLMVVHVYSDRNPGDYYLFDAASMKADLLVSRRDWINPDQMSEQRPIQFKTRDGQLIHGFLTLPRGVDPKKLPLVVHPHGGPFGIYDEWGWSPDVQLLASRGYAVLQVNYRGSGGYGRGFRMAAKQSWDSMMIDDITDGVRWTIQQGYADAGRICIYGGSYGGYASLMSAVREPDLYRCVIGYAGVYDLNLLKSDSDITLSNRGARYFKDFIGASAEQLKAASPITYLDRLKAAVMIVHGDEDWRAPPSQARALRKALDERHYPYEWMMKAGEGHGFYLEKNRQDMYEKMLAFLDRNIGGKAAVPAQPAAQAAKEPATAN